MLLKLAVLPGDGIGPEVTDQAVRVAESVAERFGHQLQVARYPIGGAALQSHQVPLPGHTLQGCISANAVLLGAVGGPAFDAYPQHLRPECGLLSLRSELGVFANLRPVECFPGTESCSPLRPEIVSGTDLLIVRELLGGLYFGEPRITSGGPGRRVSIDTMRYTEVEIDRVARVAFELARARRRKVVSVDKANVLDCSRLWRDTVNQAARDFPDIALSHAYVDSFAMDLVAHPADYDVVLTENMFGDILSDLAGGIAGSLGLLASASVGAPVALYEPVHGSAPKIAGKGIANPVGAILSIALMLRYSFNLEKEAQAVHSAVATVLQEGGRTADLTRGASISTAEMGDRVVRAIHEAQTGHAALRGA